MNSSDVPMMFRAPLEKRCQLQRLVPERQKANESQDAEIWVDQWDQGRGKVAPHFSTTIQTQEKEINWRMVSNSGQDAGFIYPVLMKGGYPFYPGSSMKGVFRRACRQLEKDNAWVLEYCGGLDGENLKRGCLRFHGAYACNENWRDHILDLAHPQQAWQVKSSASDKLESPPQKTSVREIDSKPNLKPKLKRSTNDSLAKPRGESSTKHSAFCLISLYRPTLKFGISSTKPLTDEQWAEVWAIWETAMQLGLGMRTSAGYGHIRPPQNKLENILLTVKLNGQGMRSRLLDGTREFRPNLFKATLRGHTLRLFGGITDAETAKELTEQLWGGFGQGNPVIGQVGIHFNCDPYPDGTSSTYRINNGKLTLYHANPANTKNIENLTVILKNIIRFSLLLGGFGRSCRRVDHNLVMPDYSNHLIGCHWSLVDDPENLSDFAIEINRMQKITAYFKHLDKLLRKWVKFQGKHCKNPTNWREAWNPNNVQVWGCIVNELEHSEAIKWFHENYQGSKTIKRSVLTGKVEKKNTQIGRIWHRMYPRYYKENDQLFHDRYIELLTLFPNVDPPNIDQPSDSQKQINDFLEFLERDNLFIRLYGS